jgi:hypothetical protein
MAAVNTLADSMGGSRLPLLEADAEEGDSTRADMATTAEAAVYLLVLAASCELTLRPLSLLLLLLRR